MGLRFGPAARLGLFYFALFAAIGIIAPFWPLWLAGRGLSPSEIGLLSAIPYLTRIVANPLVGHWVDHRGDRKRPIAILALAAVLLWLLFPATIGFWPLLLVTLVAYMPFNGLMPVTDSLALMVAARHRLDYGRIRLWGSLAFIAAATLVGHALPHMAVAMVAWLLVAVLAGLFLSALILPDIRVPGRGMTPLPVRPLLRSRLFLLFLAATALNQAAHSVYYTFATLHWKDAGLSDATIGLLWSEGVVAEIVLFAFGNQAVARFGPSGLILLAGLGGMARWVALGLSTDVAVLALAQILHAATFGCALLGTMHFIQRAVPPALSVRAQGISAAVAGGLVPGVTSALVGPLYEGLGGRSFLAMAGLSLVSVALAGPLLWHSRAGGSSSRPGPAPASKTAPQPEDDNLRLRMLD